MKSGACVGQLLRGEGLAPRAALWREEVYKLLLSLLSSMLAFALF